MNVNAIFDAIGKASQLECIKHRHTQKMNQLRSVQARRCGNCDLWMKNGCIPEKKHKQFKSTDSMACGDFTLSHSSERLIKGLTLELKEIQQELEGFIAH